MTTLRRTTELRPGKAEYRVETNVWAGCPGCGHTLILDRIVDGKADVYCRACRFDEHGVVLEGWDG